MAKSIVAMPKETSPAWTGGERRGTENANLPGFVAIGNGSFGGAKCWNSSFLPRVYQGTQIRAVRDRVEQMLPNIRNPRLSLEEQRRALDFTQRLNRLDAKRFGPDPVQEARIHAFELAFHMQTEAADVFRGPSVRPVHSVPDRRRCVCDRGKPAAARRARLSPGGTHVRAE